MINIELNTELSEIKNTLSNQDFPGLDEFSELENLLRKQWLLVELMQCFLK